TFHNSDNSYNFSEIHSSSNWENFSHGSLIERPDRHEYLWMKWDYPKAEYGNAALFLYRAVYSFEVFKNGSVIYSFGSPGRTPIKHFTINHIIPLGSMNENETIYFRFHSDWKDIGINGVPLLGEYNNIMMYAIRMDFLILLPGFIFIFLSAASFLLYRGYRQNKINLYFSLFSLCMSIITLYHSNFKYLLWNQPYFWSLAGIMSIYTAPVLLFMYAGEIFTEQFSSVIRKFKLMYLIFVFYALIFTAANGYNSLYWRFVNLPFSFLALIGLLTLFFISIFYQKEKNHEARIFLFGFAALFTGLIPQLLYEIRQIDYPGYYSHWSFLFFVLIIGWIIVIRYRTVHSNLIIFTDKLKIKSNENQLLIEELNLANTELEEKVRERTKDLKEANKIALEESRRASQAEKQIARLEERKIIYSDLHDHMGARLTDLSLNINHISNHSEHQPHFVKKIQKDIKDVISMMRNRLYRIEDMDRLSSSFCFGLHLRMMRRYSDTDRELIFKPEEEELINSAVSNFENSKFITSLVGATEEIITNDLKYGKGISEWKLSLINQNFPESSEKDSHKIRLLITMKSESNYEQLNRSSGHGSQNILERCREIHGKVQSDLSDGHYCIELNIPLFRIT
ncbi:MAG: hypothetical protein OEZ34_14250, partial [Spirochaetia bacterium]|nr:hypothetical protein [Spirochaetia bacterium]